ncbi:MAG: hypothetical protein JSR46_05355 [Verrucomicrobia bacterium]|nr:hypothetical protein [Verrucomicrobiota bacterium]
MMHFESGTIDNPYDTHSGRSMACLTCEPTSESSPESKAAALINELDPADPGTSSVLPVLDPEARMEEWEWGEDKT